LWRDADLDIPIFIAAQAESAKLKGDLNGLRRVDRFG
jgi:hypothetical protein